MSTTRAVQAATGERGGLSLDYQALMTCHVSDGWLHVAEEQLADWLRQKKHWDVDTSRDGSHESDSRTLRIVRHAERNASSLRARLVEPGTDKGTWTTELIAHDRRGAGDWIDLTVRNDRGHFVDVPVLARYLMQSLPLGDGELEFVDAPQVFGENRVEELLDLLCDEERHGQVFVAGSDAEGAIPFGTWVEGVGRWTRQVYGLAQVVVLDPAATTAFARIIGVSHRAPPWTIRTYFPGVDPATTVDARRHRMLGTERLAGNEWHVRSLLGRIARTHAAGRLEPPEVARVRRVFERLDNKAIVEAVTPSADVTEAAEAAHPTAAPETAGTHEPPTGLTATDVGPSDVAAEAARYLAESELTRAILRIDVLDEATLRAVAASAARPHTDPAALVDAKEWIESQQVQIERLQDQAGTLSSMLDEEQLDHAVTGQSLSEREDEARWLRSQLREQGAFGAAHSPVPSEAVTAYPESFLELHGRLAEPPVSGIVFCGNPRVMLDLDDVDHLQRAVRTAWDGFLVLGDYVRARREGCCEGGFDAYQRETPDGFRSMPPNKYARSETRRTMDSYGEERVLPVPANVDPAEQTTMRAHFRLAHIGTVSPRMYFLDRFHVDGQVYVGYIGAHMTNTQTN